MNLETFLRQANPSGAAWNFGFYLLGEKLVEVRKNTDELIAVLERVESCEESPSSEEDIASAVQLASAVAGFFVREHFEGKRALELAGELQHAARALAVGAPGASLKRYVPAASLRARRLRSFVMSRGASEIAFAFGRAKTLHANAPYIVMMAGIASGVAAYVLLTIATPPGIAWLRLSTALLVATTTATGVASAIGDTLAGRRFMMAWPLIALILKLLPFHARERYCEEFRAEMYELGLFQQMAYSINVSLGALELRRTLMEDEQTADPQQAS